MGYQFTNPYFATGDNPCLDKVSFMTEKEAEAAKVQAAWDHDAKNLKVYNCEKCGLYHLTSDFDDNDDKV